MAWIYLRNIYLKVHYVDKCGADDYPLLKDQRHLFSPATHGE